MSFQDAELSAALAAFKAENDEHCEWERAHHEALDSWLGVKGFQRYEVPADGHCQLSVFRWGLRSKSLPVHKVRELRMEVAVHLRDQVHRFASACDKEKVAGR